MEIYYCP